MRIAFLCRTPIHVFRTIQLKRQLLKREDADVYLFDTFPESGQVARRLRDTGMFANVYEIAEASYLVPGKASDLRTCLKLSDFSQLLEEQDYDQLFGFNIYGAFNDLAVTRLKKHNPKLIFHMVEDGPSIYHIERRKPKTKAYLYPLLGLQDATEHIDFWWFSCPKWMEPFGTGEKRQLPTVNKKDVGLVEAVNHVFGYREVPQLKQARLLFMEECYRNDGLLTQDLDAALFDSIRRQFPEEKCLVKLHPRSRENRFADTFPVMPQTAVPWEVYALNENLENKILISLSCATMISSKLLFDEEPCSLLLYPVLEQQIRDKATGRPYFTSERKQKLELQRTLYRNPQRFRIAQTLEEGQQILQSWIDRRLLEEMGG